MYFKAIDYVTQFQEYSLIWLNNQNQTLSTFLTYGRDLTSEEELFKFDVDEEGNPLIPHSTPKLEDFKNKVCINYRYIHIKKCYLIEVECK